MAMIAYQRRSSWSTCSKEIFYLKNNQPKSEFTGQLSLKAAKEIKQFFPSQSLSISIHFIILESFTLFFFSFLNTFTNERDKFWSCGNQITDKLNYFKNVEISVIVKIKTNLSKNI